MAIQPQDVAYQITSEQGAVDWETLRRAEMLIDTKLGDQQDAQQAMSVTEYGMAYVITLSLELNDKEKAYLCNRYRLAGWRHVEVYTDLVSDTQAHRVLVIRLYP